jgi:alpha-maltose-1-phosphate synthase
MPSVLHLLSQRPSLTGSGVTLDALVRHAATAGWQQQVVAGVPADDPAPAVGGLDPSRVHPLVFGAPGGELDFALPGMSDVMPYPSSVWSAMTGAQLEAYRAAWRRHLGRVIAAAQPDVIHAHHVWLMSALLKDVAPEVPVVVQCHATGLRQLELCPHLADEVRAGSARNERFVVLHNGHAEQLTTALDVEPGRVHVVGAGYREELFHARGRATATIGPRRLIYIGKYSAAKGLPWLLDALDRLAAQHPGQQIELHVAGSGAGPEAEALAARMRALPDLVLLHGQLAQPELAELLRSCEICVLPSLFEGVPLVLVEAMACGCRLVSTALPGVLDQLAPQLGQALELVSLPRLEGPDRPVEADLPRFVDDLVAALQASLDRPLLEQGPGQQAALQPFGWGEVFARVEAVWRSG